MPAFLTAADSLLGKIANRTASAWLRSAPAAFALDSWQRASLGVFRRGRFYGRSLDGGLIGSARFPAGASRNGGESNGGANRAEATCKWSNQLLAERGQRSLRILDITGTAEIFSSNLAISSGSGTLSIPSAVIAGMADGAYPAGELHPNGRRKSCDPATGPIPAHRHRPQRLERG